MRAAAASIPAEAGFIPCDPEILRGRTSRVESGTSDSAWSIRQTCSGRALGELAVLPGAATFSNHALGRSGTTLRSAPSMIGRR
jgi:hypothetical protein